MKLPEGHKCDVIYLLLVLLQSALPLTFLDLRSVKIKSFDGKWDCCTYFEGELHHGQHMDLGCLPVGGYTLSDLLRLQTTHGVVLISREAYFRPQDLCQCCERSRTRSVWGTPTSEHIVANCWMTKTKNLDMFYVGSRAQTLLREHKAVFFPVPISCRAYRSKRWLENERMSFDCFTTAKWNRPLFTRHRRTTHIGVALSSPNRLIYHSPCCSHFNARRNPPRPFDREERSGRDRKENPLI